MSTLKTLKTYGKFDVSTKLSSALLIITASLCLTIFTTPATAEVTWSGDVVPDTDPTTWDTGTYAFIGQIGSGTLNITDGGAISSGSGCIGDEPGSTGVVTVDGLDSTWTNNFDITVGNKGNGTLNITGGGAVSSGYGIIGYQSGSTGVVNVDGSGSTLDVGYSLSLGGGAFGNKGNGTLNITNGGIVKSYGGHVGDQFGSTGVATVSGAGSTWTNGAGICVGSWGGSGTLNIMDGGIVNSASGSIGYYYSSDGGGNTLNSTGVVTVDGTGSTWTISGDLNVGDIYSNSATLNITNGGLVSVYRALTIDVDGNGASFINMSSGGMLALDNLFDSTALLDVFLERVEGTDAIRYWDDSIGGWANITGATYGEDYTLDYITDGDLAGYTMLTVTAVPEPATLCVMAFGAAALLRRRRREA